MKALAYLYEHTGSDEFNRLYESAKVMGAQHLGDLHVVGDAEGVYVLVDYEPEEVPDRLRDLNIRRWVFVDTIERSVLGMSLTLGNHRIGATRATVDGFGKGQDVGYQIRVVGRALKPVKGLYRAILQGRQPDQPYVPTVPGHPSSRDIEEARTNTRLLLKDALDPVSRLHGERIAVALGVVT